MIRVLETAYYEFLNHFAGSYTKQILGESITLLNSLWPYLVVGIVFTTIVKLYVSKETMSSFLSKKSHTTIIIATLIGVLSPIGSYVIIPMAGALLLTGVPLPPLMALIMASPIINPNLFFLTAGAFGFELAIMRIISSILLGLSAGYTTKWLTNINYLNPETIIREESKQKLINFTNTAHKVTLTVFFNDLYRMTRYVSKFFFIAIVIAATIKILVSPFTIVRLLNGNEFLSVLITTGAGVPFYICGGAAIPVVQQLAELGLSKGAVLAFFISGPATKLSSLYIINSIFKTKVLIIYLVIGTIGAFIIGTIYNMV